VFALRVGDDQLDATRGHATDPVATIVTESGILQQVLWHERAVGAGGVKIVGDRRAGERFLKLFPLRDR
jgi:hypothetical protein